MIPDAANALEQALRVNFATFVGFGGLVDVEIVSRPWASITVSGAKHRLFLRLAGSGALAAANAFLHGLGDRDFALKGHILADIAAIGDMREDGEDRLRLTLEALTVEEG